MAERTSLLVILGLAAVIQTTLAVLYLGLAIGTVNVMGWAIGGVVAGLLVILFAIATSRRWPITLVVMLEMIAILLGARFGAAGPLVTTFLLATVAASAFLVTGAVALQLPWRTANMPSAGGPVLRAFLGRWVAILVLGAGTAILLSHFRMVFLPARILTMVVLMMGGILLWAGLVLFNTDPDPEVEDLDTAGRKGEVNNVDWRGRKMPLHRARE